MPPRAECFLIDATCPGLNRGRRVQEGVAEVIRRTKVARDFFKMAEAAWVKEELGGNRREEVESETNAISELRKKCGD